MAETKSPPRPLYEIARDIRKDWVKKDGSPNVWFGAVPYVKALESLDKITDDYGADSGTYIVAGFLGNAQTWRGDVARAIKKELNDMLKHNHS